MSDQDQVLWKNEWIQVILKDGWYTCVKHSAHGVLVLGLRREKGIVEALIRIEHTPPHGSGFRRTSITGMIDEGETFQQAAKRELAEEAGYHVDEKDLTYLGFLFPLKSTDYEQHVFVVDLTGLEQVEIVGDGTRGEVGATVEWHPLSVVPTVQDAGINAALLRAMSSEKFESWNLNLFL